MKPKEKFAALLQQAKIWRDMAGVAQQTSDEARKLPPNSSNQVSETMHREVAKTFRLCAEMVEQIVNSK